MSEEKSKQLAGNQKGSTADLFVWNRKLVTGLTDIDQQHLKLVQLINDLHRAMKSRVGAAESGRILRELAEYTVYHFDFEEKMFARHGYPGTEDHKKIHVKLVGKVTGYQQDFESGKAGLSMELMDFLCDWLRDHILKTDMGYVPFMKEKGVK